MPIYLNNAATTWPKPSCVAQSMMEFLMQGGANLGRGTSSQRDLTTLNAVMDCRIQLADLFVGYENRDPRYVTFCSNVTEALNFVIKGFLRPGMKVLTSGMEHNAVVRPLRSMERRGIVLDFMECGPDGFLSPSAFEKALNKGCFDLVVLSHASNVCGTVQDLDGIAAVCRRTRVPLVVDSAQTAGLLPLNVEKLGLAPLCITGHKGLMGPQGIGGIIWRPDFASRVEPLIEGGTGSYSHIEVQPSDMPDKFESGTPNLPGIVGLKASLDWLQKEGIENIERRERELGSMLLEGLKEIDTAVLYGKPTMEGRLSVFAVNFRDTDNGILADGLSVAGFETRPGLHCAPLAHKTLGSYPQGSLRVSPGYFNTPGDVEAFLKALRSCIRKY